MSKLVHLGHDAKGTLYAFHCPGCECSHQVRVPPDVTNTESHPCWSWNGSMESPTFNPSILVYGSGDIPRCHSFVRDGRIQYLDDCTHGFKGQTIDLPEWS